MSPGQSKLPSDSIKVVPGRSKLRVESSNPVARGNPLPKTSKVKLITPEEAMGLSFGVNLKPVSPISEPPRRKPARATSESLRPEPACETSGSPRPIPPRQTPEATRPIPPRQTPEAPRPIPPRQTPEAPRPVPARPTSEVAGFRKEIVCGLRALSMTTTTVRQRTNPRSLHQSRTVDPPPSPRALQIRSRVKQQAANATQVLEGTVVEVGDRGKDHCSKETCQSTSDERLSEFLLYRPALHPTWKGRIVDSAMLPEFDCEFWAKPASKISGKALRLSKEMSTLLKVELLPTGHVLNDLFDRSPRLSNVELYLFPDEKKTERFKGGHAHLFEAMVTRNAMIKVNINGTELLIFSSKLLDKTSHFFINTQNKTENYLWGFFVQIKISQALVPGTSYQTDKDLDDGDVVDMELDTEYPTPSLALKLIAESQHTPSISPEKVNREVSLPPGFENPSRSLGKVNKEVSLPPGFENPSRSLGKVKKEVSVPPGFENPSRSPGKVNEEVNLPPGFENPSRSPGKVNREVGLHPEFENLSRSPGKVNKEVSLPPGFENPSRSLGKVNKEVSLPPGFEKTWTPPLAILNIHGTSNHLSDDDLTGSAGLVRNESGKWVFGYMRCHKSLTEVAAGLLAIYHGLKLLWDSGYRRIRLETTSREIIDALTTKSGLFQKRQSILGSCKDMILKDWECDIYHISKEQNSCAEWLASRLEGQPQGLIFFEYPPRGLVGLLEKDRLAAR